MPTGYTHTIKQGIDFKQFALDCAQHFGASVVQRDGEQIPVELTVDDYHKRAAQEARERLKEILVMTAQERETAAKRAWEEAEAARVAELNMCRQLRESYESMLSEVLRWKPPTRDHVGLKEFMKTQIIESMEADCDDSYYTTPTLQRSGAQWAADEIARLNRTITYHNEAHAREAKRTTERNAWLRELRKSLQ